MAVHRGHCLHENCPSTDNGVAHYVLDLPESKAGTIWGFVHETPSTFSLQNSFSQESYHFKIRTPISLIYFGREPVYPAQYGHWHYILAIHLFIFKQKKAPWKVIGKLCLPPPHHPLPLFPTYLSSGNSGDARA